VVCDPVCMVDQSSLPSRTVTFLFTDVEGSTRLWEEFPDEMRSALERHDGVLRTVIESHGGYVFRLLGIRLRRRSRGPLTRSLQRLRPRVR
jgi:class 3 adenylate cyclase